MNEGRAFGHSSSDGGDTQADTTLHLSMRNCLGGVGWHRAPLSRWTMFATTYVLRDLLRRLAACIMLLDRRGPAFLIS